MKFIYDFSHVCEAVNSLLEAGVDFFTFPAYDFDGNMGITIMFRHQDEFLTYFREPCGYNPYREAEYTWKEDDDGFGCIQVYQAGVSYEFCPADAEWFLK